MDTSLFYFVNGICAMLIDIAILCVPIPTSELYIRDLSKPDLLTDKAI